MNLDDDTCTGSCIQPKWIMAVAVFLYVTVNPATVCEATQHPVVEVDIPDVLFRWAERVKRVRDCEGDENHHLTKP